MAKEMEKWEQLKHDSILIENDIMQLIKRIEDFKMELSSLRMGMAMGIEDIERIGYALMEVHEFFGEYAHHIDFLLTPLTGDPVYIQEVKDRFL